MIAIYFYNCYEYKIQIFNSVKIIDYNKFAK